MTRLTRSNLSRLAPVAAGLLASGAHAVIVLGNGVLWVELGLLALVLSLPSVARLERRERRP